MCAMSAAALWHADSLERAARPPFVVSGVLRGWHLSVQRCIQSGRPCDTRSAGEWLGFEVFLNETPAAIAGKLANHRRHAESPVIHVDQIDTPPMRCGVVRGGVSLSA
jgi:hypothetical protein